LVEGPSGRYFIPIAPLAFLLLYRRRSPVDLDEGRWSYAPAVALVSAMLITSAALAFRYWIPLR
jgi:hypothetical protein